MAFEMVAYDGVDILHLLLATSSALHDHTLIDPQMTIERISSPLQCKQIRHTKKHSCHSVGQTLCLVHLHYFICFFSLAMFFAEEIIATFEYPKYFIVGLKTKMIDEKMGPHTTTVIRDKKN